MKLTIEELTKRAVNEAVKNEQEKNLNNREKLFKENKMKLYIKVCASVAGAFNCTKKDTPTNWAKFAVSEFEKEFKD